MAVQFKFRSSIKFDSVDLEGRASISVRDLKAEIIRHNHLNICQDSDLVFSDALTGQEYRNENIQIPSGSAVIIKRVPVGSAHVDIPNFNCKDSGNPPNIETIDFDDFGVDVYPVPEATVFCSGLDADKDACSPGYEPNTGITRCLELAGGCQKPETSGIIDAIPGHSHGGAEQTIPQPKSRPGVQEDFNLEKIGRDPVDAKNAGMPSEMKCSLCDLIFKEAVMIPCCQHSFCEKCIRQMLIEKARCPRCFSTKYRIEDLLPNISLRQAIEHFQESQNFITIPDNAVCHYAPDGESGIQAKDVSCGGSIFQRESKWPHSPETGIGSNNCLGESACYSPFRNGAPYHFGPRDTQKIPSFSHKNNQFDGERCGSTRVAPYGLAAFDDFQGESKPIPEKAEPVIKKKGPPWVFTAGGGKWFLECGRNRKGDRACYMCGSRDHLLRECPVATSSQTMLHSGNAFFPRAMPAALHGYVPPYWDGVVLPHTPSFRYPYENQGMTAFHTMLNHPAPFSVHPYMHMPSMYRGPGFGGYMGMGGVIPLPEAGEGCDISRSDFPDPEGREKRRKISKENLRSDQSCDDDEGWKRQQYYGAARLQDHKSYVNREKSVSYSSDGSTRRYPRQDSHRNEIYDDHIVLVDGHWKTSRLVVGHREGKLYNSTEKLSSETDDLPSSSSGHSEEKHKHYHRRSRKENEIREQCDSDKHKHYHRSSRYQKREQCCSDSSRSHHQYISEKDDKRKRNRHDFKRQKHHSNSGSGLGHSISSDKWSSHNSEKSEHKAKSSADERGHDRWKMVSGSDEDQIEDYRYCKRKRVN